MHEVRFSLRSIGQPPDRTSIVRLALEGKTMTQICQIMRHTAPAVNNYSPKRSGSGQVLISMRMSIIALEHIVDEDMRALGRLYLPAQSLAGEVVEVDNAGRR